MAGLDASNITAALDSTRSRVAGVIKQAATATGTSFEFLLSTAKMESNLNPEAAAPTSSAKGLFQFIDQTWLGTVKEAGAQLGYGKYADAISKSDSGSYSVADPDAKAEILKLRDDPVAASAMAGVLTQSNSFKLTGNLGRRPSDAELYMAHFMGVGGATKLITNAENNPSVSGAALFPNAAAANKSIFYDSDGNARSVSQVYSVLTTRYAAAAGSSSTQTAVAGLGATAVAIAAGSGTAPTVTPAAANAAYLARFPDPSTAQVASFAADPSTPAAPEPPIFRSLFQAGDRSQPVSSAVQELWGNGRSLTSVSASATAVSAASSATPAPTATGTVTAAALPPTPQVSTPKPLDLFSDRSGTFSN